MSEFDQRQYRIMFEMLEWIEGGGNPSNVTGDLMILFDILEEIEPAWASDFGDDLSQLHADTAIAAVRAQDQGTFSLSFDPATKKRMQATAARMKQLVLAKIEDSADDTQDID